MKRSLMREGGDSDYSKSTSRRVGYQTAPGLSPKHPLSVSSPEETVATGNGFGYIGLSQRRWTILQVDSGGDGTWQTHEDILGMMSIGQPLAMLRRKFVWHLYRHLYRHPYRHLYRALLRPFIQSTSPQTPESVQPSQVPLLCPLQ